MRGSTWGFPREGMDALGGRLDCGVSSLCEREGLKEIQ